MIWPCESRTRRIRRVSPVRRSSSCRKLSKDSQNSKTDDRYARSGGSQNRQAKSITTTRSRHQSTDAGAVIKVNQCISRGNIPGRQSWPTVKQFSTKRKVGYIQCTSDRAINFAVSGDTLTFSAGVRTYAGNTLRAQATVLIHELGHQLTLLGFQPIMVFPSREGKRQVWTRTADT